MRVPPVRLRMPRWPGWAQALAVYAAARLVSLLILLVAAERQAANLWTGAAPPYLEFAGIWDGEWYRRIAENGYPLPLPRDPAGQPVQSAWAFYPAYPFLVRAVMVLLGTSWTATAPVVSVLLGAAAAVVVHRLFALAAGHRTALVGVLLVVTFPTSPVLQLAYSESLALLLLASALYLLVTRRYVAAVPVVALLGFTRAVALPFAAVVAVHLLRRWWRRREHPFRARERLELVVLGATAAVAGVAWPLVVAAATGELGVYAEIQAAWRGGDTRWLTPWWTASQRALGPWLGPVVLVLLAGGTVWALVGRRVRGLPPELSAWCLAYLGYLLVVVEPYTSVFRFLLLAFPLALLVARVVRGRAHLLAWVVAFVALQVVWVLELWHFTPPSDLPP